MKQNIVNFCLMHEGNLGDFFEPLYFTVGLQEVLLLCYFMNLLTLFH